MARRPTSGIWWLHPGFAFSAAGIGTALCAYLIPDATYRIYWRTPKFFDVHALEIALLCVAAFVFGCSWGRRLASGRARAGSACWGDGISWSLIYFLFRLSFWLCLLGYALWTALAVHRGVSLSDVISVVGGEKGAMYEMRYTYLPTVGGVTTLTQFGPAVMVLGAIVGFSRGWGLVRLRLGIVGLLAVFRALINSERFAIIELAVPFLITYLALRFFETQEISAVARTLLRFAPVLGLVALLILFTGFEYIRSWSNYYAGGDLGFWEFGSMRLLGYYATSFNNGAYLLERLDTLYAPYFSLHSLWGFPLSGPAMHRLFPNPLLESADKWFYFPFLEEGANVEFNNAGGMLFPLMDFGVAGGLVYWLLMGLICGVVYQAFCRRELPGLLLYPFLFLSLLEIPLALYWAEGRSFPSLCVLAGAPALLWLLRRRYWTPARLSNPVMTTQR